MSWYCKLRATIRPQSLDSALDDEFRFHVERRIEDFITDGMTREQACREAARLFGNSMLLRETTRDRDVLPWLQTSIHDLRYALRTLRRSPGFTMAAVLSLALGIGANIAIFTLLDQIILRTLPVPHPEQLVKMRVDGPIYGVNIGDDTISYPMYRDLRDGNQVFSGVLGHFYTPLSVAQGDRTERVEGELVTGNYFEVLGIGAALGRTFEPRDDVTPNGHPLAVLSYDYWVNRFHQDPAVLGQSILVDGTPLTIVGVSDRRFDGVSLGHSAKIRIPIAMKSRMTQGYFSEFFNLEHRRAYWVKTIARLKPGISREKAQASLQPLFHSILEMEVRGDGFSSASASAKSAFLRASLDVFPGSRGYSSLRREYDAPLRILMAIVGLVLLIACANVANLLLARAAARQREIAVRLAIGASASRIARQALAESLLLAIAGGAAGLLLAVWLDRVLLRFLPTDYGPVNLFTVPDGRILLFTLSVCLLTGLLFGLVPALATRKVDVASSLKVDSRTAAGGQGRVRQTLVAAQVALSALLLIIAGQFLHSLTNLRQEDTGLHTRNVLEFSVNPSLNGYDKEQSGRFYRALLEKLRATHGVENAAASALALLDQDWWSPAVTIDDSGPQTDDQNPNANLVSAGYFEALGIPLELGRNFTRADALSKHQVALINQSFARRYFPGRNPVGHYIALGNDPGIKTDIEVIGVVRDSKFYDIRREIRPQVYFDDDQNPDIQQVNVYLRTTMDRAQATAAVRQIVHSLDANVPMFAIRTLDEQAELTLARENLLMSLTSAFGALATILAAIGIYGLMSFNVARRTREIAVRMALGARSSSVKWLVMRETLMLTGVGMAAALPASWVLTRLVEAQLYGVKAGDPGSLWLAVAALALVAALAGYLPVRRAAGIEPTQALRAE
ncbi:MAG TPA: ABC transporter permease [Bryobacteraceae bacterium]|nr:ABC transporter permease [Bryobacteraceae bacterium]